MMLLFNLFELLASFIESYFCYKFNFLFFQCKISERACVFLSVFLSVIIFFINKYSLFSFLTLIVAIIFIDISLYVKKKVPILYSFSVTSFYSICLLLFDFFSISLMGLLGISDNLSVYVEKQTVFRYVFILISKMLLIVSFYTVKKIVIEFPIAESKKLLLFTAFGYIGIVYMLKCTLDNAQSSTAFNWLLLIMLLFLVFFSFSIFLKYKKEVSEKEVIRIRNDIVAKNYKEIASDYHKNAMLFHDMNNHILVLQNMVEKQDYKKLREYLKNMSAANLSVVSTWTGNDTMDCIINIKKKVCENLGIIMLIDSDPINVKVDDFIITTILSNLIDNAIEACQKQNVGSWITIALRHINEMLIFKIENSINDTPVITQGDFVTQKQDKNLHGLGIKSVESAVKKIDGVFTYYCEKNKFTALVTVFL